VSKKVTQHYKLQKEVKSTQKEPSCEKMVQPLKAWVKKL